MGRVMDAITAVRRMKDASVRYIGFDRARQMGLLGSYMEMMNRGGSGGYSKRDILAAKVRPGVDPLRKAGAA
jgi:hypothetical protein